MKSCGNGFPFEEDVSKAKAELAARKVQYEQALRDEKRFAALAADGVVAARDAELYAEASKASYNAMLAASDQVRLLENGMRPEQISAAEANVARAESPIRGPRPLSATKNYTRPLTALF